MRAGTSAYGAAPSEAPAAAEALRTEDAQQAPEPAASFEGDTSNTGGAGVTVPFAGSPPAATQRVTDVAAASPPAASNVDQSTRNSATPTPAAIAALPDDGQNLYATDESSDGPPILVIVSAVALVAGVTLVAGVILVTGMIHRFIPPLIAFKSIYP